MLHKVQNTEIYNTYSDSSITKQFLHIYHYKMYIYKLCSEYKAYKASDRQVMWRITTCFGIWQWSSTNYCFINNRVSVSSITESEFTSLP